MCVKRIGPPADEAEQRGLDAVSHDERDDSGIADLLEVVRKGRETAVLDVYGLCLWLEPVAP